MSQKTRPIRVYYFPCDFHQRRPFRKLRKQWPYTADWFLLCCSIAREAMAGGRIEAGGQPLLEEDLEDLYDVDPKWIAAAIEAGLLEDSEGGIAIPNWHEYFNDRTVAEKSITDTAAWQKFCLEWNRLYQGKPMSSSDLVDLAYQAGIHVVMKQADYPAKARSLGRILSGAEGKSINGLTIERAGMKHNTGLYSIRSSKVVSEDNDSCSNSSKKDSVSEQFNFQESPKKGGEGELGGGGELGETRLQSPKRILNVSKTYPNPKRILNVSTSPGSVPPGHVTEQTTDPKTLLVLEFQRTMDEARQIASQFGDVDEPKAKRQLELLLENPKKSRKTLETMRRCWATQLQCNPDDRVSSIPQFLDFVKAESIRTSGTASL